MPDTVSTDRFAALTAGVCYTVDVSALGTDGRPIGATPSASTPVDPAWGKPRQRKLCLLRGQLCETNKLDKS